MSRAHIWGAVVTVLMLAAPAAAQPAEITELVGRVMVEVRLFRDGVPVDDPATLDFIETKVGQPLSMRQVRESITHLVSLGEFADVPVSATEGPRGVVLRYDLVPLQAVAEVEIRGSLGRPREELLDLIRRRFSGVVRADQVPAAIALLEARYGEVGRFAPGITADTSDGRLVFEVDQGPAARIGRIDIQGVPDTGRAAVLARLRIAEGAAYDPGTISTRLAEYEADVRAQDYYEARFRHDVTASPDGLTVDLVLDIQTGSPVRLEFEGASGDAPLAELVPVAREGSIDEDLLEDWGLALENYLRGQGYRDAQVTHRRDDQPGELSVVFTVDRGPQYRVAEVRFAGASMLSDAELRILFDVTSGAPFVAADVDAGAAAVAVRYAELGFRAVEVRPALPESDAASGAPPVVVPVSVVVDIVEGPRTTIGALVFEGNTAFTADELASLIGSVRGAPFYVPLVAADGDAVLVHYLNEGYETVEVDVIPRFDESGATADVVFAVREGPQVVVDHVLVVGNRQIAASTIRAELALRSGQPLGRDDKDETLRRLTDLGLFRRVQLREFSHGGGNRRDVVVVVEEAPATRVSYGGGLELSQRLRATDAGAASERLELAPRGFFQIGRRNLWGKNRSIDLFTRVSLRRKDAIDAEMTESRLGFNEYRVLLNYGEPRAFGQSGDLFIAGFIEQAIRPSFDLFSRGVSAEFQRAIGLTMTGSIGYTYGRNRVTNPQLQPEDVPLVDRLFPEVTLSSFSSGLVRDARDDPLDPTGGSLVAVEGEVAFQRIGSAVGYVKTSFQGSTFRRLPGELVFAAGARLGLARGLTALPLIPDFVDNPDGVRVAIAGPGLVLDLPASERFFAGGDTTVRGFALDRLGDDATIDSRGFPTGGNAMVVLKSELRVPVTRALQVVGFLDAGNVFDRVSNLRLGRIRGAAGFGVRYRSPVGPIRVDLGFKLDRRELPVGACPSVVSVLPDPFPTTCREPLTALHVSIGQAF